MNKNKFLLAPVFLALCSLDAQAIMVNDQTYRMLGGDPDTFMTDSSDAVRAIYQPLHEESFQDQFLGVVADQGTATWIGKDSQGYAVFILSAHQLTGDLFMFFDWQGNRPMGTVVDKYVHPDVDIAVIHVDLGENFSIKDKKGNPIQQPILYDGDQEEGHVVSMVGYGRWGAGELSNNKTIGKNSMERRAWGQTIVGDSSGLYLKLPYDTQQDDIQWAKSRSGDSGMSYWQRFNGFWTISGVHSASSGADGTLTLGIRVSAVKDWIEEAFPGVKWYSEIAPVQYRKQLDRSPVQAEPVTIDSSSFIYE